MGSAYTLPGLEVGAPQLQRRGLCPRQAEPQGDHPEQLESHHADRLCQDHGQQVPCPRRQEGRLLVRGWGFSFATCHWADSTIENNLVVGGRYAFVAPIRLKPQVGAGL